MRIKAAGLLLFVFLAACAMPETRIYTLNLAADNSPRTVARDATVLLITNSPKHLAQPYIACRTSPYQLVISRYAKWEASPEAMVRDGFKDSLSATLFREARPASFARNGSYGVSMFFVVSGFVITRTILRRQPDSPAIGMVYRYFAPH